MQDDGSWPAYIMPGPAFQANSTYTYFYGSAAGGPILRPEDLLAWRANYYPLDRRCDPCLIYNLQPCQFDEDNDDRCSNCVRYSFSWCTRNAALSVNQPTAAAALRAAQAAANQAAADQAAAAQAAADQAAAAQADADAAAQAAANQAAAPAAPGASPSAFPGAPAQPPNIGQGSGTQPGPANPFQNLIQPPPIQPPAIQPPTQQPTQQPTPVNRPDRPNSNRDAIDWPTNRRPAKIRGDGYHMVCQSVYNPMHLWIPCWRDC